MESFTDRLRLAMRNKGLKQVDLCNLTGEPSSKISQLTNGKVTDPRLSTAIKIAEALEVSLDYLAGRTDNPMGFCDEELEGLRIDAEASAMLRGFSSLPPDGRDSVMEQVELQQLKSAAASVQDHSVSGAA